jgi:RNase adapter protein RapZ
VAIGCTGGQHRSVVVGEALALRLRQHGWPVSIRHRDAPRAAPPSTEGSA